MPISLTYSVDFAWSLSHPPSRREQLGDHVIGVSVHNAKKTATAHATRSLPALCGLCTVVGVTIFILGYVNMAALFVGTAVVGLAVLVWTQSQHIDQIEGRASVSEVAVPAASPKPLRLLHEAATEPPGVAVSEIVTLLKARLACLNAKNPSSLLCDPAVMRLRVFCRPMVLVHVVDLLLRQVTSQRDRRMHVVLVELHRNGNDLNLRVSQSSREGLDDRHGHVAEAVRVTQTQGAALTVSSDPYSVRYTMILALQKTAALALVSTKTG
jgi:hypothetical protein